MLESRQNVHHINRQSSENDDSQAEKLTNVDVAFRLRYSIRIHW